MTRLRDLVARLLCEARERAGAVLWARRRERELEEELRFHLDLEAARAREEGLSGRGAENAVRRRFGSALRVKEEVREARGARWLEDLGRDLRVGARGLRRRPGFAAAGVLTLGLGIGAATAVFALVDAALLRPLPYPGGDRLALVWQRGEGAGARLGVSGPDADLYRRGARRATGFAFIHSMGDATLLAEEATAVVLGRASPELFPLLGVEAALGRVFVPGEGVAVQGDDVAGPGDGEGTEVAATTPTTPALVSHRTWHGLLGGDSAVLGRTLALDGQSVVLVGVLPPDFRVLLPAGVGAPPDVDVWVPLPVELADLRRSDRLTDQDSDDRGILLARLAPGVGPAALESELRALHAAAGAAAGTAVPVVERLATALDAEGRPVATALVGAVALVLLLACANVAALLLTRAVARRPELRLRAVLGASRGRMARQALAETGLVAGAGAAVGVAVGFIAIRVLAAGAGLVLREQAGLDPPALLFAGGATVAAALLAGVLPALSTARGGAPPRPGGARTGRARAALNAVQVALSLALLMGAGLLVRSAQELRRERPGFEAHDALQFDLHLVYRDGYRGPADRARFVAELERRLGALPGVRAVGAIGGAPLGGRAFVQPYGHPGETPDAWGRRRANFRVVTPGAFEALGTRVVAGRGFTPDDDRQDRRVALVDRKLAARLAPDGHVLGTRIGIPLDGEAVEAEVVGVVENVRYEDVRVPGRETVYVPYRHEASRRITVVVRGGRAGLAAAVRAEVARLDGRLVPHDLRPLASVVAASLAKERFVGGVLAVFAGAALLLAVIGLYAATAEAVSGRRREIGVRLAVGAPPRRVVAEVAGRSLLPALAGLVAGLPVALLGGHALGALRHGVGAADPVTLLVACAALAAASLAAVLLPARKAAATDPAAVLRVE